MPGCDKLRIYRDFCKPHYRQWKKHGDPTAMGTPGRKPGSIPWNKGLTTGKPAWNSNPLVDVVCQTCGQTFQSQPRPTRPLESIRFCSVRCHGDWKASVRGSAHPLYRLVDRTCERCGATFKGKPAKVKSGEARFCSRNCVGAYSVSLQDGRRSSIELMVEAVLIDLGESFEAQKPLGPWTADFYLPCLNLVIECDGDYWHSLPKVVVRDRQKNGWLLRNGYRFARLSERDIRDDARSVVLGAVGRYRTV